MSVLSAPVMGASIESSGFGIDLVQLLTPRLQNLRRPHQQS
ncbi:Protein of unknown function [Pyronema omphalodes CBS 100304]|uniref:Uncharacterized protein n=1 Tax=Pyronema omphalodes (strain CBS 100304) TaxID=1076935 RepID=U4L9R0_PYROM|nr:Protein of unknown function [Pyronema omphalodes CBS 100304]